MQEKVVCPVHQHHHNAQLAHQVNTQSQGGYATLALRMQKRLQMAPHPIVCAKRATIAQPVQLLQQHVPLVLLYLQLVVLQEPHHAPVKLAFIVQPVQLL